MIPEKKSERVRQRVSERRRVAQNKRLPQLQSIHLKNKREGRTCLRVVTSDAATHRHERVSIIGNACIAGMWGRGCRPWLPFRRLSMNE